MTYCLVHKCITCICAVKGLIGAASSTPMQGYTAGNIEMTGGFWVLFGNLDTHFSGLAGCPLDLF